MVLTCVRDSYQNSDQNVDWRGRLSCKAVGTGSASLYSSHCLRFSSSLIPTRLRLAFSGLFVRVCPVAWVMSPSLQWSYSLTPSPRNPPTPLPQLVMKSRTDVQVRTLQCAADSWNSSLHSARSSSSMTEQSAAGTLVL
ncbi:hypothetical protein TcWFU_003456 [Taenia crassiceps]|uniref:Uncharacterized protein n=1 Tax=Taenia crassiceps TaxID=6207 RepID=A0ABR4QAS2_9CEST